MIHFFVKLTAFTIAAMIFLGLFFLTKSDFFISSGSDAAEIVVRVNLTVRIAALIIIIVSIASMVFRMSTMTSVSALVAFLLFILSLNIVRISGRDFEVVQSFMLVPVMHWEVDANPAANNAKVSISSTWCCLVSNQASGPKTIIRGIWPLVLPKGELQAAFEGLIFR